VLKKQLIFIRPPRRLFIFFQLALFHAAVVGDTATLDPRAAVVRGELLHVLVLLRLQLLPCVGGVQGFPRP
jgi:hypothetical protein